MDKLKEKIESHFWRPGYRGDLRAFVLACETCARAKEPARRPRATLEPIMACRFNQIVEIDVAGPFPQTPRGNR